MALSAKWLDGDLIFYDGIQEVYRIKNSTEGVVVGESDAEVPVTLYGDVTNQAPTITNSTSAGILTTASNRTQFVDSCGESITYTLPAIADCKGIEFKIVNFSTAGDITINDTGAACIAVVSFDEVGYLLCDGATWGAMVGGPSTGA